MGRLAGEPTLATKDPALEAQRLGGRPFFIVHGLADTTVLPHHAVDLAAAAFAGGTAVEPWIVPGSSHTQEVFDVPDRYEARLLAFFSGALGAP
jgi:dipeptidyl aminopeptidase/acylaminoacyl peptidase